MPAVFADSPADPGISPGAMIDQVTYRRANIFDLSDPEENNWLYRWANRLHVRTRESTIREQLLFEPGDTFDPRLLEESERILRSRKYFWDASIEAAPNDEGGVDVIVDTRDVWTLMPEVSISRSGGENKTILGVEEDNLLGYGQRVQLTYEDNVDRESTAFEFSDPQIGDSWVTAFLRVADNSDGHERTVSIRKPFHELDARRAAGLTAYDVDQRRPVYSLGNEAAEYRQQREYYSAFAGLSRGLRDGWVTRYTAGVVYDDNRFSTALEPTLPALLPQSRKLVYPYVGFELLEDDFEKTANHDQMERAEDFYLGTRLTATLGWSDTAFDADRDALVFSASANHSYGRLSGRALLLSASTSGRVENGDLVNSKTNVSARFYWRQSDKRLFFALFDATAGHELDLDNLVEIGGDSGLRGYPLRYQTGDGRALLTIEQRYFTDWYPFRLFRVGGAVFFDIGRGFGDNPAGEPDLGWLKDVGFGLRFAPTRLGTRKIVHLDFAFPLDGDPTIDDVQILLEAKQSF
jgi:outer membrane protein assembly factor BamA